MAKKGAKKDVDVVADYHGFTAEQMRLALEKHWPQWRGLRSVRVIHGQGVALKPELERWCAEMGIAYAPDANNPGSTRIFPTNRVLPTATLNNTLAAKGLRLTPEQEAELRDPQAALRARQEAQKRQQEEARKRRAEESARVAQQQRDQSLWQAEMARLDAMDKDHARKKQNANSNRPAPPIILPPAVLKKQEGYWRAEIVRVADTDTETLKKQKKTGLDKLAPPIEPKPATPPPAPQRPAQPARDEAADRALFEAEMARLEQE